MKKLPLLLFIVALTKAAYTQSPNTRMIDFDGYVKSRLYGTVPSKLGVMDKRIDDVFSSMKPPKYAPGVKPADTDFGNQWFPKTPAILGITSTAQTLQTYEVPMLSKSYTGYLLGNNDSVNAVVAMGINKNNLTDYRFRVIENDSVELMPWTIPHLQQQHGAKQPYGYLRKFFAPGKEIMVEVINVHNYNYRDGIVFNWRNKAGAIINRVIGFRKGHRGHDAVNLMQGGSAQATSLHLSADSLDGVNVYFKNHRTLPYDIYWIFDNAEARQSGRSDTALIQQGLRDSVYSFSYPYLQNPGKYKLLIYPTGTKDKKRESSIVFDIEAQSAYKGYTILQLLPYLLFAGLAFLTYYLYSKRKLKKAERLKEKTGLQLAVVRAQLNPHFMFNALSSIQSLINQGNSASAASYLNKFAVLTRKVLNLSVREMISVEDELNIIENYLKIEQLRFGFNFDITVDNNINIANTQIPSMLMQPFIENAAKHGVGALGNKGIIKINFDKRGTDFVLRISDNGLGFNANAATTGFGINLSKERLAFLNQIYKGQFSNMQINSSSTGTNVTITIQQWF